jgi:mRNA interferase RelE/StbE
LAWQIRITRTAEKQINALDRMVQTRVTKSLREIMKELKGNKAKLWRYRVGDYRVICDINDTEKNYLYSKLLTEKKFIDKLEL